MYEFKLPLHTFSKIKQLSKNIKQLSNIKDEKQQQSVMQKSGEIIAEILDDDLETSESEISFELNFAVLKFKHTIKKGKWMTQKKKVKIWIKRKY